MPTRFLLMCIDAAFLAAIGSILSVGHNYKTQGALKNGCRKRVITVIYRACTTLLIFLAGCGTSVKYHKSEYEEYLGPLEKRSKAKDRVTSTYTSNHVSWLDVPII